MTRIISIIGFTLHIHSFILFCNSNYFVCVHLNLARQSVNKEDWTHFIQLINEQDISCKVCNYNCTYLLSCHIMSCCISSIKAFLKLVISSDLGRGARHELLLMISYLYLESMKTECQILINLAEWLFLLYYWINTYLLDLFDCSFICLHLQPNRW